MCMCMLGCEFVYFSVTAYMCKVCENTPECILILYVNMGTCFSFSKSSSTQLVYLCQLPEILETSGKTVSLRVSHSLLSFSKVGCSSSPLSLPPSGNTTLDAHPEFIFFTSHKKTSLVRRVYIVYLSRPGQDFILRPVNVSHLLRFSPDDCSRTCNLECGVTWCNTVCVLCKFKITVP